MDWYHKLRGDTEYDKLLQFWKDHVKKLRISSRSKRWWDNDLSDLLKKLRNARRGGRTKKNGVYYKYGEKFKRWKGCTEKIKMMITERCGRTYYEENSSRDPYEIVKWVKDPWRLKTRMRNLKNMGEKRLLIDQKKWKA